MKIFSSHFILITISSLLLGCSNISAEPADAFSGPITTNDLLEKESLSDGSRVQINKPQDGFPTLYSSRRCWKVEEKFRCLYFNGTTSLIGILAYTARSLDDEIKYNHGYSCEISFDAEKINWIIEKISSDRENGGPSLNFIYSTTRGRREPWSIEDLQKLARNYKIKQPIEHFDCLRAATVVLAGGVEALETVELGVEVLS